MNKDRKSLAIEYLNAVGKHQFDKVEALLAPDIQFRGPAVTRTSAGDLVGRSSAWPPSTSGTTSSGCSSTATRSASSTTS
jgi:hypothetical protein